MKIKRKVSATMPIPEQLQIPQKRRYGLSITLPLDELQKQLFEHPHEASYRIEASKGIRVTSSKDPVLLSRKELTKDKNNDKEDFFETFHNNNSTHHHVITVPPRARKQQITITLDPKQICELGTISIKVGEGSELVIVEQHTSGKAVREASHAAHTKLRYCSQHITLTLADQAHVEYVTIQDASSSFVIKNRKRAELDREAQILWIDCHLGGHTVLADTETILSGEGSKSQNYGFIFAMGLQRFDSNLQSRHVGRSTLSNMASRSVQGGRAKAIYRGLIHIGKNAAQSEGYQKSDTILLSSDAEADPIPQLAIENDDVKCSHGASVGTINPESLLYLMSRGLDRDEATRQIVEGFFFPIIDRISTPEIRAELKERLEQKYQESKDVPERKTPENEAKKA